MRKAIIHVSGLIQGIGFRPFIYRLAVKRGLRGSVRNLGDAGVRIEVYGPEEAIRGFLRALIAEKPPVADYTSIDVRWGSVEPGGGPSSFVIAPSDVRGRGSELSTIPPDIAICDDCLKEMYDPRDRHHLYPFTCCAVCGPRFTTIKAVPYDRERTTMDEFPMCEHCSAEFYDPTDRRFDAQTICCPLCGPKMALYGADGERVGCSDPIAEAAKLIREGYAVAVKGIGGLHIAVRADWDEAVRRLRERRGKPAKPLAVMSLDVGAVEEYAIVSDVERELLESPARPIVVLEKAKPFALSELVAPGLHTIGAMLPYSGIHHLLLDRSRLLAIIMTSANMPGEPMIVDNDEALRALKGIADYTLLHDRLIWARCDDSVVRVVDGSPVPIRRSRGYVPLPVRLPFRSKLVVASVGPELMATGAILVGDKCFLTQHVGDVEGPESLAFLEGALSHLAGLLGVGSFDVVACDMHPLFLSRGVAGELAERSGAKLIDVQHHHAHVAALMAEAGVKPGERVVGIACDGVGYGPDGTAWGGELLLADYASFERLGHLEPQPMPGGDVCAVWYGRMLQAILHGRVGDDELRVFLVGERLRGFKWGEGEVDTVFHQLKRGLNVVWTTSAGRLLDAVACLLGLAFKRTYEGEGAMKLEAAASGGEPGAVEVDARVTAENGSLVLKTGDMVRQAYEALSSGHRVEDIACGFQLALARGLAEMAIMAAERSGVNVVGFTGGVAYNDAITKAIREAIEGAGLSFIRHRVVPCGDGGISLGQAVAATHISGP